MANKPWWKSKGVWAGIITAIIGCAVSIAKIFGYDLASNHIFGIVVAMLGVLGVYGRATANTTINNG